jgi:hypothetical protein
MKHSIKTLIPFLFIMLFALQTVAADSIDDYLADYEKFVTRVEKYVEDKNYNMLDKIYADNDKFKARLEKLNKAAADWTIRQTGKRIALSTRYGTAVGVLETQKGLKKAEDYFDEDEKKESSSSKDA